MWKLAKIYFVKLNQDYKEINERIACSIQSIFQSVFSSLKSKSKTFRRKIADYLQVCFYSGVCIVSPLMNMFGTHLLDVC